EADPPSDLGVKGGILSLLDLTAQALVMAILATLLLNPGVAGAALEEGAAILLGSISINAWSAGEKEAGSGRVGEEDSKGVAALEPLPHHV
ncbi:hypothetical protein OFB58_26415, partial [Escherichia coli]|nr:hypothetical protein [Escherichia coli]